MDNLAEKGDKCGVVTLSVRLGPRKLSVIYGVAVYPLFWVELLNIEVNRRTFNLSELSVILWVSAVKGCPL